MASESTYLTIPETVKLFREAGFRVNAPQVRRWVNAGRIKAVRLPNGRAQIKLADAVAALGKEQAKALAPTDRRAVS